MVRSPQKKALIHAPLKCSECRERRVVPVKERYDVTIDHDGRSYGLSIPKLELLKCESCGNRILPDASGEQVNEALRQAAGLLSPGEMKQRRLVLGLTQKEMADHLRIAEATLSRWETGAQIQQRGYDLLLRVFFEFPTVREHISSGSKSPREPSPLEAYLREIDETALLTADQEKSLARLIGEGSTEARDQMVRANLRLVVDIARGYTGKRLALQDLIEEGNLGLLQAVEGFDPTMKCRFSAHASYWIKQSIERALANTTRTSREGRFAAALDEDRLERDKDEVEFKASNKVKKTSRPKKRRRR